MSSSAAFRTLRTAGFSLMAVAIAVWACGCGRSPSEGITAPPPEVRGSPIKKTAKKAETAPTAASATSQPSGPENPALKSAAGATSSTSASNPPPSSGSTGTASPDIASVRPAGAAAPTSLASTGASLPLPSAPTSNLGFDLLAGYSFEVSDELLGPVTNNVATIAEKTSAQIPAAVKSYDKKKVSLKGFMLPLKVEGGLVTEMLIMKDQSMCCYGTTPRINDWVSVKMKKKGVRPTMDLPVTLFGTMRIGEMRENGYLVGIYSMEGETMEAPDNP